MVFLFPLLLIVATVIAVRSAERGLGSGGAHWQWFAVWTAAGAALTFSFLAGLSIGPFVLPFAAVLLVWVARRAPRLPDALGFVAGVGVLLVVVAFLNRGENGLDPMPWLLAGVSLDGLALVAYIVLSRHGRGARSIG